MPTIGIAIKCFSGILLELSYLIGFYALGVVKQLEQAAFPNAKW